MAGDGLVNWTTPPLPVQFLRPRPFPTSSGAPSVKEVDLRAPAHGFFKRKKLAAFVSGTVTTLRLLTTTGAFARRTQLPGGGSCEQDSRLKPVKLVNHESWTALGWREISSASGHIPAVKAL